jgi:hypothetical protein
VLRQDDLMSGSEEATTGETGLACEEALAHLRLKIEGGAPWYPALLEAVALWRLPDETVGERRYRYLVGGEAFDWLLLAERLVASLDGLVPQDERDALLFRGCPPVEISDGEFKRLIGEAKHKAHLNYLYGVTVEEALQLAVEEELHKERFAHCGNRCAPIDEEAYQRIYGKGRAELLERFREESGLPPGDAIGHGDLKAFTYWLFKYRLRNCDRARVASDTRKGLVQLTKLGNAARRRSSHPSE